jgi:phage baseplate assembly protein W
MELYVKDVGDPNFNPNKVHIESEIQQLITQIENTLFTNRAEVLGSPEFGCNLEDLVYSLGLNEQQIKSTIDSQLQEYCPLAQKYNVESEIRFFRGTVRDIAYVDITIDSKYLVEIYVN